MHKLVSAVNEAYRGAAHMLGLILGVFGLLTWQLLPYFQTIAH